MAYSDWLKNSTFESKLRDKDFELDHKKKPPMLENIQVSYAFKNLEKLTCLLEGLAMLLQSIHTMLKGNFG